MTSTKLFFIQKQSSCLFACSGSNKARKNYKHPLINLIRLSVKRRAGKHGRSDQWRREAVESEVLCSKRARSCRDGFLGSSLQARARLSWNKRGMTLLMKGRELTRIALAQCSHSFCQSRLQRYNKVHGYNEAWAHLTLNCVESLPWDVIFFSSFFTLPLHFWLYSFGVCVLLQAIYAHSLEKIKENYVGKQIPSFPWFSLSFPYFNMQIDVCKNLAYLHMTPGTQLSLKKQEHCSILSPTEWFRGNSLTIVGSIIRW